MKVQEKKPVGRPRKYAGRRPTWTVRLDLDTGEQVKSLAEKSGRSISEVCEYLIKRGINFENEMQTIVRSTVKQTLEYVDQQRAKEEAERSRPRPFSDLFKTSGDDK